MNNNGRRLANGRVNGRLRKTQEELDQDMDDYWGNVNGAGAVEKTAIPAVSQQAAPAPNPTAGDDDIDMIE
jgi:THO complex subunit 4